MQMIVTSMLKANERVKEFIKVLGSVEFLKNAEK